MIEPINFFGALRRAWRLVAVLVVVGAVVAVFLPVSSAKPKKTLLRWEAVAVVGAAPSSGILSGTVTTSQILFFANSLGTKLAAIYKSGLVPNTYTSSLATAYTYSGGMFGSAGGVPSPGTAYPTAPGPNVTSGKQPSGGSVILYAQGHTAAEATALVNDYSVELGLALENQALVHAAATAPAKNAATTTPTSVPTAAPISPYNPSPIGYQIIFPGVLHLTHRIKTTTTSALDSHKVRLVAGALAGLLLALIVILIREVLDSSLRRAQRAKLHFKFPVIAEIPETYPPDGGVVDLVDRPTSAASEAYRKLRMSVLFEALAADAAPPSQANDGFGDLFAMGVSRGEPYKVPDAGSRSVILVTSTADEPSRAKVVANLAAAYAEASQRVIVISAVDLEVGTTYPALGVLSGPITPTDVESRITPAGPENVSMLSMRHFVANSGQLVNRAREVFDAARQVADVVIVEAPAFLRFHHGEALVHSVDAVVIVAEYGETKAPAAKEMGEILRRLGAPVLGVVFTGAQLSKSQRRSIDATGIGTGSAQPVPDVPEALDASGEGSDPVDATLSATPELHPS